MKQGSRRLAILLRSERGKILPFLNDKFGTQRAPISCWMKENETWQDMCGIYQMTTHEEDLASCQRVY